MLGLLVFGTLPLWNRPVGLYEYLGVETSSLHLRPGLQPPARVLWPAFVRPRRVLRHRRVRLGWRSLPRGKPLELPGVATGGRGGRRLRRALHLASPRHLLRPHDRRLRPALRFIAIKWTSSPAARTALNIERLPGRWASAFDLKRNGALFYFVLVCSRRSRCCCGGWCTRGSGGGLRRSGRTRPAPASSAKRVPLQGASSPSPAASRASPAGCSRWRRRAPSSR